MESKGSMRRSGRSGLRTGVAVRSFCLRAFGLVFCLFASNIVAPFSVFAQESATDTTASTKTTLKSAPMTQPGLTVTSSPSGALVELKGVAQLAGLAPVFFSQGIPGRYELRVSKAGYETYHTSVQMSNERVEQVDVRLEPKTRGKAAIRSLLWPGWGQFYSGQKTKGGVMTALAIVAGATVALAEIDYQNKKDDFDIANASYQEALQSGSIATLASLNSQRALAQADAHDAESLRRAAVGGAIAVWSVSFLDALFFSPSSDGSITVRDITIAPETDLLRGYAGFTLSKGF